MDSAEVRAALKQWGRLYIKNEDTGESIRYNECGSDKFYATYYPPDGIGEVNQYTLDNDDLLGDIVCFCSGFGKTVPIGVVLEELVLNQEYIYNGGRCDTILDDTTLDPAVYVITPEDVVDWFDDDCQNMPLYLEEREGDVTRRYRVTPMGTDPIWAQVEEISRTYTLRGDEFKTFVYKHGTWRSSNEKC